MGCFSYTCSVSGLPIDWSTPIRFLALSESGRESRNIAVNSIWEPLTLPIRGKYDDYGSIEDIEEGGVSDAFFAALDRRAIEREVGENSVHDVAVARGMSRKDWLQALWEGRVQVKGRHQPVVEVVQTMIREDVWQCLVARSRKLADGVGKQQALMVLEVATSIEREQIRDPALEAEALEVSAAYRALALL